MIMVMVMIMKMIMLLIMGMEMGRIYSLFAKSDTLAPHTLRIPSLRG